MIKPKFTQAGVAKYIRQQTMRMEMATISRLQYIGETFINDARTNGNYLDQTGNLRSSIGYVIFEKWRKESGINL